MTSLINSIKNELYSNNKINWKGVLFIVSEPIAIFAAYFLVKRGLYFWNNPDIFSLTTFGTVIFGTIAYFLRIPYMWNKPSALFFLVANIIIWTIALAIWINAFIIYQKYKQKNMKIKKK